MKTFKINFIVGNKTFATARYADSVSQIRTNFQHVIIAVYEVNEVGAIIG